MTVFAAVWLASGVASVALARLSLWARARAFGQPTKLRAFPAMIPATAVTVAAGPVIGLLSIALTVVALKGGRRG